jgi:hypothetical protein
MMAEVDRVLAEIVASRPAGHFDAALGLLRTYALAIGRAERLAAKVRRLDIADARYGDAVDELCTANREACSLAEVLHLLPGDQAAPPPRVQ